MSVGSIGRGQGGEEVESVFFGWLEKKKVTEYNKQHYEDALCFQNKREGWCFFFFFFCFSVCALRRIEEQRASKKEEKNEKMDKIHNEDQRKGRASNKTKKETLKKEEDKQGEW